MDLEEKIEQKLNTNGGTEKDILITSAEYNEFLKQKEELENLKSENLTLRQKINKLEVEIRHKGSMAEAIKFAMIIDELNDLLFLAGLEKLELDPESDIDLKAHLIQTIKNIIETNGISYRFTENENLAVVISNLKELVQRANMDKIKEESVKGSVVKY